MENEKNSSAKEGYTLSYTSLTLREKWLPTNPARYQGDPKLGFCGRWARTVCLASALLLSGMHVVGNNITNSEGARTGRINKISNEGRFWKTYEGELALEGIVGDGETWQFSIERNNPRSDELVKRINQYRESGTKVQITYREPVTTWPWRSGTNYLITDVQPVAQSK